jgi:hypothetical protein
MNTFNKGKKVTYTWELNGNEISPDPKLPNAITLKKNGGTGEGTVSLQAVMDATFPQYVRESLDYIF